MLTTTTELGALAVALPQLRTAFSLALVHLFYVHRPGTSSRVLLERAGESSHPVRSQ